MPTCARVCGHFVHPPLGTFCVCATTTCKPRMQHYIYILYIYIIYIYPFPLLINTKFVVSCTCSIKYKYIPPTLPYPPCQYEICCYTQAKLRDLLASYLHSTTTLRCLDSTSTLSGPRDTITMASWEYQLQTKAPQHSQINSNQFCLT